MTKEKNEDIEKKNKEKSLSEQKKGITVKREEDTPEWYSQVCLNAELADYGPVKGTMVIRPYGYAIWQAIMDDFNKTLKKYDIKNAYFPLFIPESFFKKEAEHAEGFKAEVAWIEQQGDSEERLAVRPTSETIIYDAYSKWIRSWRDLPLRINQWCNVVRWEVSQCKLFLRSREFLWQEGHCVYETEEQCDKEVLLILEEYEKLCKNLLAIPVIAGKKTDKEKFAGAKYTATIEGFTAEGKALQCGTSHNLGQGFAKSFDISYLDKNESKKMPWQNSWGISTRLIGGAVMTHSDNKGLVLPPNIAPNKVVIVPIIFENTKEKILKEAEKIQKSLENLNPILDDREGYNPGYKFNEWELKGIPLRIEIGPKDLEKESITLVRRDTGEKTSVKIKDLEKEIPKHLERMQNSLYDKAKKFLDSSIQKVKTWEEFEAAANNKKFILAPFCGEEKCEALIKEKSGGVGSRCIPFKQEKIANKCVQCNKPAKFWTYFARAY
jgi:prolyl-tRNA synthetase